MGNNYCKQLGIKPNRKITGKDFDLIWKKYDTTHQGRLNKHQAQKFLKNFAQAVGEPYDKNIAAKLFDDCDEEKVGWITYSQFKKLFFNVATLKGSLSPAIPRQVIQSAGNPPEEPPVYLTNSLRVKLTRRPSFWQYVVNEDDTTDTTEESTTQYEDEKWEEEDEQDDCCLHDDHLFDLHNNTGVDIITPKFQRKVSESPFVILTKEEIDQKIEKTLWEVSKLLSIPISDIGLLLRVFNWDKDKLYANYFDSPEKYLGEAGICIGNKSVEEEEETDMFECPVCMDEVEFKDSYAMACGHRYCKECWSGQLKSAVDNYGANVLHMSKCLYPQCSSIVNREIYEKLADSASYKKYVYFFNKNYIENNSDYTYCPADCGNAVKCRDALEPTDIVECTCGKIFCFKCGNEYHNPVTCDQLKVWNEKNEEDKDGASLKLIQAISKPCPACGISTDRVDGCNHMTCQKCMHEWCWQCRAEWSTHGKNTGGFYYCNRYDNSDAYKQDKEAMSLREEHNRFLHYYNGYYVNHKAEEGSKAMKEEVEKKGLEYYELTGGDQQFLVDAVESLIRCRHILKYTYIYGYFLPHIATNEDDGTTLIRTMFEVQQAFAQNICENLSKELLKPVSELERNKVVYNHKACLQYFNNLVNFFHNDEEKEKYSPRIDKKTMKRKNKKKTKDEQRDNNRWICSKCTFSNPTSESICSLCNFDRSNEAI